MFAFTAIALAALTALPALGQIVPTSPSGTTVVTVGDNIPALWTEDTTGTWTDVEIQLMTGDNLDMVTLSTLATGVDGTTTSGLNIVCPDVTPYSKIYFLQFTLGGNVSTATWTTRFTIAPTSGATVDPAESTVYSGVTVEWGTGALVSNSTSTDSTSNSTTVAATSSDSAVVSTISAAAASESASATDNVVNAASASTTSSQSSGSASAASAAASASQSGAAVKGSTVGLSAVVLALAAMIAV